MQELKEGSFRQLMPLVVDVIRKGLVPFLWGPPGLGKSAMTRAIAAILSKTYTTLDALLFQPTDFAIPVPDKDTKTIELYRSGFIPTEGQYLVSIEDLPHAKAYQQVPLLQIVLDRRIAKFPIGSGVSFIATGNRAEDNAYTHPIAAPLLNRFVHFYIKPDANEWAEMYAKPNRLDERVVMFNQSFPEHHYAAPIEGVHAFPTPRTWEFFSHMIKDIDVEFSAADQDSLDKIRSYAVASVGDSAAAAFLAWYRHLRGISAEQIVKSGAFPMLIGADRSKMFAIILSVGSYVSKLSKEEFKKHVPNIIKLMGQLENDYKITYLRYVLRINPVTGVSDASILKLLMADPTFHQNSKSIGDLLTFGSNKSFVVAA